MSVTYADRVIETSTTTGTGTFDLDGAEQGFQTFVAGVSSGAEVYYVASDGTDWEVGRGTVTSGTPDTLSRDTVLDSSNAGSAVNFSAGTKTISLTVPAPSTNPLSVYFPGNVVGTVSQSSGDITGAIIETGSNASGEYTKFADGTLVVRRSLGVSDTGFTAFSWPSSFINTSYRVSAASSASSTSSIFSPKISNKSTTGADGAAVTDGNSYANGTIDIVVIGYWF